MSGKASQNAHGLTRDVLEKIEAKYDLGTEAQCMKWIESVTGIHFYTGSGCDFVLEKLKDGIILCNLINKLKPGSVKKISDSKIAFKQMENIGAFLSACANFGVSTHELFQTVDLYEKKNPTQVLVTILALGRQAQSHGFRGPVLS